MRQRKIPGVDPGLLIKDAAKLMPDTGRRAFLRGAASLGALHAVGRRDPEQGERSHEPM